MNAPHPRHEGEGTEDPHDEIQAQGYVRCIRSGCTCQVCCDVNVPASALLRSVSPVAEYVSNRAEFGPRRCACRAVAS